MLLRELTALRGASGAEGEIRDALRKESARILGEKGRVYADTMGNLYAHRPGSDKNKPHVMLVAHMDEVGFIVRFATEEGLLKFASVGSVDPRVVASRRVLVGKDAVPGVIGFKAVHLMTDEEYNTPPGYDMLSIDIGAKTREEAERLCPPGSYATFDSAYRELGDGFVKSKALDDRVGCYVLLEALEKCAYDGDLTCAFTVQEEVGMRGAKIAGKRVMPDVALVLEGTTANDMGDAPEHLQVCTCGKGPAISFMDRSAIMNKPLRRHLFDTAKRHGIPVQDKRYVAGGTDSGPITMSGAGVACCTLAVPCRYIHSPASMCKLEDVDALRDLVIAAVDEMQ